MKTFKDCILEIIDEKNMNNEYFEEDILIQGIDQFVEDRDIEKNLERFKHKENVYNKLLELKVKHFRTYTYEMLVFYFMNYSVITGLIMIQGEINFKLNHNIEMSLQERNDLYKKSLSLVGQCHKLEYADGSIDYHLKQIRHLLQIAD